MLVAPTALRERTSGCDPLVLACILSRHVTKTNGHLAPWTAGVGLRRSGLGAPRRHGIPPRRRRLYTGRNAMNDCSEEAWRTDSHHALRHTVKTLRMPDGQEVENEQQQH